jgi:ankyrin repeat protein
MSSRADFLAALKSGDLERLRALLANEPDLLNARSESGLSPVLLALYHGQPQAARLVIEHGAVLDLFEAAAAGEQPRVEALLEADPGAINAHAPDGFTPLGLAAFFGHQALVERLLANGADPNVGSSNNMRVMPLHSAAANRDPAVAHAIAALLLDYGAEVNARQEGGYTPLHEAASSGKLELARLLLLFGADPSLAADDGSLPAALAARHGRHEVVRLLQAQGSAH